MEHFESIVSKAEKETQGRETQQLWSAEVMRSIIRSERAAGAARLYWAWEVKRRGLWRGVVLYDAVSGHTKGHPDHAFDSFEEWLEYACQNMGVTRTTKAQTVSFATALAPWLSSHHVVTAEGRRMTPSLFLTMAGIGKVHDIKSAWYPMYREVERYRAELDYQPGRPSPQQINELQSMTNALNERIVGCIDLAVSQDVTRENLDQILKERGWRESKIPVPSTNSWKWSALSGTEFETVCVVMPSRDMAFFKDALWMYMEPDPSPPEEVFPIMVATTEQHTESIK